MKQLKTNDKLCTGCLKCEDICSGSYRKEINKEKSAIRIESDGDSGYKVKVCDQCGECINACPSEAIYSSKNGVVRIKKSLCVGCLACVAVCPNEVMFYHDDLNEPFKCIACGLCAKECSFDAIFIEEN